MKKKRKPESGGKGEAPAQKGGKADDGERESKVAKKTVAPPKHKLSKA